MEQAFSLKTTDYLQKSMLGLPFYIDMDDQAIDAIVDAIIEVTAKTKVRVLHVG